MGTSHEAYTVNVLTQNVMLDKTLENAERILPQALRIGSLAATLSQFAGSLDVVGIQEVHKFENLHCGEALAESTGYGPGYWHEHNQPQENPKRGRKGEYMGMFGAMVEHVEVIELSDERKALMTVIDGVAYITYHLRAGIKKQARLVRAKEAQEIVEALESFEDAVLIGDPNEPNIPRVAWARQVFAHAEFTSALDLAGNGSVKTFPTAEYQRIRRVPRMRLDEISVRGNRISVVGAGTLKSVVVNEPGMDEYPESVPRSPSDHELLWASLSVDPQT